MSNIGDQVRREVQDAQGAVKVALKLHFLILKQSADIPAGIRELLAEAGEKLLDANEHLSEANKTLSKHNPRRLAALKREAKKRSS